MIVIEMKVFVSFFENISKITYILFFGIYRKKGEELLFLYVYYSTNYSKVTKIRPKFHFP